MKIATVCLALFLVITMNEVSRAQAPRTITYQGIIQKDGSAFNGDGLFIFTLYRGTHVAWKSQPITVHVAGGLVSTAIGPFPDSMRFAGVDSLSISFNGTDLSPRVALTSVVYSLYSLYAQRAAFADSSATPGPAGPQGAKGEAGPQGVQGEKGDRGDKGEIGAQGPKGDKGEGGESGIRGDKGERGEKGEGGVQGLRGDKGEHGEKGEFGIQGLKGDKGDHGEGGLPGLKGDRGDKGEFGLQGSKGDRGDHGEKGDKGDRGEFGLQGLKGDRGDRGDKGDKGDHGENGLQGMKGDKGEFGSQGLKGDRGDRGEKGDKGDRGDFGPQGLRGDRGDRGDRGEKGERWNPENVRSTVSSNGTVVVSLKRQNGVPGDEMRLVRTGNANMFRLEVLGNQGLAADYSAVWYMGNGVEARHGSASGTSSQLFNVGAAHQLSILLKFDNQCTKVDLFRTAASDDKWYGVSIAN